MKKFALRKMDIIVINLLLQKSLLWSSSSGETNPQYFYVVLAAAGLEKGARRESLCLHSLQ